MGIIILWPLQMSNQNDIPLSDAFSEKMRNFGVHDIQIAQLHRLEQGPAICDALLHNKSFHDIAVITGLEEQSVRKTVQSIFSIVDVRDYSQFRHKFAHIPFDLSAFGPLEKPIVRGLLLGKTAKQICEAEFCSPGVYNSRLNLALVKTESLSVDELVRKVRTGALKTARNLSQPESAQETDYGRELEKLGLTSREIKKLDKITEGKTICYLILKGMGQNKISLETGIDLSQVKDCAAVICDALGADTIPVLRSKILRRPKQPRINFSNFAARPACAAGEPRAESTPAVSEEFMKNCNYFVALVQTYGANIDRINIGMIRHDLDADIEKISRHVFHLYNVDDLPALARKVKPASPAPDLS